MRKVVLVSGGSRGIGAACVRRFAREGWSAVFLYRASEDAAGALTAELRAAGLDCAGFRCDVSDEADVARVTADILQRWHHIDALVNNAGISSVGLMTDMDAAAWRRLFDTNVLGAFLLAKAVLPGMISRQGGSIIQIASMWGEVGASCEVAYSASKAALIGMTKALAKEAGPSGVRVNCVSPGVIDTDMNARLTPDDLQALADETPLGRIGTPEETAAAVYWLASEQAGFITGQVLGVNGGMVV